MMNKLGFRPKQSFSKLLPFCQHTFPELVSFDIFETLLIRTVATPNDVNRLLARRLRTKGLCDLDDDAFIALRRQAEDLALRENRAHRESQTTLREIAKKLGKLTGLPFSLTWSFAEQELELEAELLHAIPEGADLVREYRDQGAKIAFISDMYLPSDKIFYWLEREGIARAGEQVFVSGEVGLSKGSGNLFSHVLAELNIPKARALHIGNNHHADLSGARLAGIQSRLLDVGNLNRYEKNLAVAPGGWGGVLAGTSRMVRLQTKACSDSFEAVAAGVIAPIILSYVMWLIDCAQKRGVDHLFFLSRDGHLPFLVAQRMAIRLGISIPMTYLYSSRRTWCLAALKERTESSLSWVLESTSFLCIRSCLARVGLNPEDVEQLLTETGFPPACWDKNLDETERARIASLLLENTHLEGLLERRKQEEKAILKDYLTQESVLSCKVIGLCDLGWHGTLQQALRNLLDGSFGAPQAEIEGYYIGVNRSERFVPKSNNTARGFLKDAYHGPEQLGLWNKRMGFFLETFCATDHGTLIAYVNKEGWVVPRLDPRFNENNGEDLRKIVVETTLNFADRLSLKHFDRSALENVPLALLKNVETFWLKPTRNEAKVWGRFPVDDRKGRDGSKDLGLASPFGWRTVLDIFKNDREKNSITWFAGSMVQTHPIIKKALSAAIRLKNLCKPK